jgi:hypothetical protein
VDDKSDNEDIDKILPAQIAENTSHERLCLFHPFVLRVGPMQSGRCAVASGK